MKLLSAEAPVLAWAAGAVLVVSGAMLVRAIFNKLPSNRPPIFEEVPFIGGILGFIKSPIELGRRGYDALGEVFTVPVLHMRMTFLIGPAVSTHFYNGSDDHMSQKEVYAYSVPTFGPDVVFAVDAKIRAEQLRMFSDALRSERMNTYVPTFVSEATAFFKNWAQTGTIDFKDQFNELVLFTASATIMGREVRENMFKEVTHLYEKLDQGMQPISVFLPYLPIKLHRERDAARKEIGKIFAKIIAQRRASGVKEKDVLQFFIDGKYLRAYGGRPLTESEITGMLITALFAGMHTSTITSSWTAIFLAHNRRSFDACVEEQRQVIAAHGRELSVQVLDEMPVLHACITEALRMFPPLIMMLRYARKAFEVTDSKGKKFVIPKGDVCVTSTSVQHRLDDLFENADKFDHARFLEPRAEDKKAKFTFIGFGGGRHGCMGTNFAYLQIKTIFSVLLRSFEFEPIDPIPEPDYSCLVVGPKPCSVKYTRRASPL